MTELDRDAAGATPLTPERLRADVAAALEMAPAEIADDDHLLDLGLDSIRLMILVDRWRAAGAAVDFGALAERPRLDHWWTLIARASGQGGGGDG